MAHKISLAHHRNRTDRKYMAPISLSVCVNFILSIGSRRSDQLQVRPPSTMTEHPRAVVALLRDGNFRFSANEFVEPSNYPLELEQHICQIKSKSEALKVRGSAESYMLQVGFGPIVADDPLPNHRHLSKYRRYLMSDAQFYYPCSKSCAFHPEASDG
jgi:hypothetical protein